MSDMSWKEAIDFVLNKAVEPMHYTIIAEQIVEENLRESIGATPAATVSSHLSRSIKDLGVKSPYRSLSKGEYLLQSKMEGYINIEKPEAMLEENDESRVIKAFGMHWDRSNVDWKSSPRLLGRQQKGASDVDFNEQVGVYILYDRRDVIYVGRSIDRPLGKRLFEHTRDRHAGRWNRFSWFGLSSLDSEGNLAKVSTFNPTLESLTATFEALLIEGLEPPQNRKRGDDLNSIEYLQVLDPDIKAKQKKEFFLEMMEQKS